MKQLLVIVLLCLSSTIFAQTKGDNVIYAKGVTFEQVVNTLLDSGFVVKEIDKDFHTVITKYKSFSPTYGLTLDIRVKDNIAIIKGKGLITPSTNSRSIAIDTVYFPVAILWNQMDSFAKSLTDNITYSKQ
jgi:hypothetical protein